MGHIVILSEEPLFSEALSGLISRELGAEVTSVESARSLAKLNPLLVDVLISTVPLTAWEGRMITCRAGSPRRVAAILSDISHMLADKGGNLPISDLIGLSEKNKRLERTDTGSSVDLTEKEMALLLFVKAEGEASREDILKNVWGFNSGVSTHTLEQHAYRLRQKWRELADGEPITATEKGYRWND